MAVKYHWELEVYQLAREGRQRIFELSKELPKEEMYSLTDQVRRSSRSVCSHIAEAWGRRPYRADFVNKLNMSESEARETQCWIETAVECEYLTKEVGQDVYKLYDRIIGKLVGMQMKPEPWLIKRQ
jgi:four helix bundle protein